MTTYPPERTWPGALARLAREDWSAMTAAANASDNHMSSLARWLKKAREINASLDPEQTAQLAERLKREFYDGLAAAGVRARQRQRAAGENGRARRRAVAEAARALPLETVTLECARCGMRWDPAPKPDGSLPASSRCPRSRGGCGRLHRVPAANTRGTADHEVPGGLQAAEPGKEDAGLSRGALSENESRSAGPELVHP